jgi:DNA-binding response OmpR family regulator
VTPDRRQYPRVIPSERRGAVPQKVLVVEDDPSIQRLIAATLRRRRFLIDVASNGAEAIAKLAANDYAMLTLDLMMPRVTGFDVIGWMALHPDRRPVSVAVISAAADNVFQKLDGTVVNAVFIKPFDVTVLGSYVSATLRHPPDRRKVRLIASAR